MTFGIIFLILLNLVDTYFVGQLGTEPLAAISFTFPIITFVMSIGMGLSVGTTSAVARALGGGDTRAARRLTSHALLLAGGLMALVSTLGVLVQRQLFSWLGAEPALFGMLSDYMTVWFFGSVFLVVPMVGGGVMRADGDATTPAITMAAAGVVNLVLDPPFIFGWGPVPAMGLEGAAIATLIARMVTLALSLYYLNRKGLVDWHLPVLSELLDSWKRILSVGLPAAVTNALGPVASAIMTALVATQGNPAVAAYGVGIRLEGLLLIAPMALSAALTPFIGQNWGAQQEGRVAEALKLSGRFVIAWGVAAWLLLTGAGDFVAGIFADEPEVVSTLRTYLWIVPASYAAHGLVSVYSAAFNAVDRAVRSTLLSALRSLALAIPLALLGAQQWGLQGLFGGMAAATFIAAGIANVWSSTLRKPPRAVRTESVPPTDASALLNATPDKREAVDALLDAVDGIAEVTVAARPINTLGFYVHGAEVGHVHRGGYLDVHLPPDVHDQVIAEGRAEHHRHINDCGWLTHRMQSPEDAAEGAWLLALGAALHRSRAAQGDKTQLEGLDLSGDVRRLAEQAAERCAA